MLTLIMILFITTTAMLNARRVCVDPVAESYQTYDNQSICCYRLYRKQDYPHPIACCEESRSIYNPEKQVCCGGGVHDKLQGRQCCHFSNTFYNPQSKDALCCSGVLHENINQGIDICCGNKTMSPHDNICCDGVIVPRDAHDIMDMKCCGQRGFSVKDHVCENNRVLPASPRKCGGADFDSRRSVCCDGVIQHGDGSRPLECCGRDAFNAMTHYCHNTGRVLRNGFKLCRNSEYSISRQECCGGTLYILRSDRSCCGGKMVNPLKNGCCDGVPYDLLNQKCCGGHVVDRVAHCCGGKVIDPIRQVCCVQDSVRNVQEHAIEKTAGNHTKCCAYHNVSISYSQYDSTCNHLGKVVPIPNNTIARCGADPFDERKDLCCNRQVHRNAKRRGRRCCYPGKSDYHPRTQKCEDGVPKRKRKSKGNKTKACGLNCRLRVVNEKTFLRKLRRLNPDDYVLRLRFKNFTRGYGTTWKVQQKFQKGSIQRPRHRQLKLGKSKFTERKNVYALVRKTTKPTTGKEGRYRNGIKYTKRTRISILEKSNKRLQGKIWKILEKKVG